MTKEKARKKKHDALDVSTAGESSVGEEQMEEDGTATTTIIEV